MQKIRISELEKCEDFGGLYTIGYSETAEGTEGGESVTSRRSVRVSLEEVGGAASAAEDAAANANSAATNATAAAESARTAASDAESAATNATTAADGANQAAETANASAAGADSAAANANEAADRANKAAENAGSGSGSGSGGSSDMTPITNEEIDELLKNFNFLDSYTVSASGEYPLTLEAQNSAGGAEITGSVDIEGIPADEVERVFNGE